MKLLVRGIRSTVLFLIQVEFVFSLSLSSFLSEKMNQALAKKDLDLAAAQKTADEKTALADQKLASVGKLEEENTKLKTALNEANREVTRLKKDKRALTDKVEDIAHKRDERRIIWEDLPRSYSLCLKVLFFVRLTCCCRLDVQPLTHL